jgi:hypothetical protein
LPLAIEVRVPAFPRYDALRGKLQPSSARRPYDCKRRTTVYILPMTDKTTAIVLGVIERAPQWIRRDLESKDHVTRVQAEESLAAMIAEALRKTEVPST